MSTPSIPWISVTPILSQGIELINSIDDAKLRLCLNRVCEAIKENKEPFTDIELQKLEKSLHKTSEQLKLTIDTLNYITRKCSIYLMKPSALQKKLTETLKLEDVKAEYFLQAWTDNMNNTHGSLDNLLKVEKFAWDLNIEIASGILSQPVIPTSLLQFEIKNDKGVNEFITVEMNENELLGMWNEMEKMMKCLDNIKT